MAFLNVHTQYRPLSVFEPVQTFGHDMFDVLRPAWDTDSYETRMWIETSMAGAGYVADDLHRSHPHPTMVTQPVKRQRPSRSGYLPADMLLKRVKRVRKNRHRGSGISLAGQMSYR